MTPGSSPESDSFIQQIDSLLRQGEVETALKRVRQALSRVDRHRNPDRWADLQNALGGVYLRRGRAQRQSVEMAIAAFRQAFRFYARTRSREQRAKLQSNLGAAYAQRLQGSHAANYGRALSYFRASLSVRTRKANPLAWARTKANIANLLVRRPGGDRSTNLEAAIVASKDALEVFLPDKHPLEWANAQNNLGRAYLDRFEGDHAENLEWAISAFKGALEARPREADKDEWAMTNNNLGNAYSERDEGNPTSNLERAIEAFELALTVFSQKTRPIDWAMTMNNLGVTYRELKSGDRQINLENALARFHDACKVRTRRAMPLRWALTQNNIGDTLMELKSDDPAANVEKAIAAYRSSLRVYERMGSSAERALGMKDLGIAYAHRRKGRPLRNLEQARTCLTEALYRYRKLGADVQTRSTAIELGNACAQLNDWHGAARAYATATVSAEVLYQASLLLYTRRRELQEAPDLIRMTAYSLARCGRLKRAVLALEQGRARELGQTLELHRAVLKELASVDRPAYEALRDAAQRVADLQAEERMELNSRERQQQAARAQALRQRARTAWQAFAFAMQRARRIQGIKEILEPSAWDQASQAAASGPVAYLLTTRHGSLGLLLGRVAGRSSPAITAIWANQLTENVLNGLLGSAGPDDFLRAQEAGSAVQISRRLETILPILGDQLLAPIAKLPSAKRGESLTLVPCGVLGRLPLHATQFSDGMTLIDAVPVSYVPSLRIIAAARRELPRVMARKPALVGVSVAHGPAGLIFANAELESAAACFVRRWPQLWQGDDPGFKSRFLAQVRYATHVHMACHGWYDPEDPLRSRLTLTGRIHARGTYTPWETLQLVEIVNERRFRGVRMLVAAACQSGLASAGALADEAIGFPAGLMVAGAIGVIGSLWSIEDAATTLLLTKFYERHVRDGMEPAAALRDAQLWLRGLTNARLQEYVSGHPHLSRHQRRILGDKKDPANAEERAYADPYYWAGLVHSGV